MALQSNDNTSNRLQAPRASLQRTKVLWRRTAVGVFLFGTIVAGVAGASAQSDPEAVAIALDEALNAHDIDAAIALWAEDAVATRHVPPPGSTLVYEGTAEIRGFLEGIIAQNVHFELAVPHEVVGDQVTWTNNTSFDPWRDLGIAPLQGQGKMTVRDGRIVEFSTELTPESQTKLQDAMRSLPGLPNTGGGGIAQTSSSGNGFLIAAIVAGASVVALPALLLGARRLQR